MKKLIILIVLMFAATAFSQTRIAVLPFENMDGDIDYNIWSYDLQDSLYKSLMYEDPEAEHYYIVPLDSIEMELAELNLDPTNPQYKSDLWKVVENLNIEKVVLGNFNLRGDKILINCYVYNVKMRMPYSKNAAKDIFKTEETIYESIPVIVEAIMPNLKK